MAEASRNCIGDKPGSMKPPSSIVSKQKGSGEHAFESASPGNESSIVFEGNLKCREAEVQSSDGNASTWSTSARSEISREVSLPLRGRSSEMDLVMQDQRTESSCSNSLSIVPPISLQNHSYQETVAGSYLLKNYSGDQNAAAFAKIMVQSSNSGNVNSSSGKEENIKSGSENDNHPISPSAERAMSSEISGESENMSTTKGTPLELGQDVKGELKDEARVNISCESSMTKSSQAASTFVAGFDLNDDINVDDMDGIVYPVAQSLSSHSVIHVMAKPGIPKGLPRVPLKFEGGLGWKGSAQTSAFRPAVLNCARSYGPNVFDLNVAAVEDCAPNGLLDSSCGVVPQKTEALSFDLNCLYDAADELTKPPLPREPRNPSLMDLDLNANTYPHGSEISDSENAKRRDFNFNGNSHFTNTFSTVQHVASQAHGQGFFMPVPNSLQQLALMQRASPFQPKLSGIPHTLPPQNYPFKGPFQFSPRDPLPSGMDYSRAMSYTKHSLEHGIFPSVAAPYFMQVAQGHNPGNTEVSAPRVDVKTEEYLSRSASKMDEAKRFLFLGKSSPAEEQMKSLNQEAWYATSAKRKEPEGGPEYYQLGYRQVT